MLASAERTTVDVVVTANQDPVLRFAQIDHAFVVDEAVPVLETVNRTRPVTFTPQDQPVSTAPNVGLVSSVIMFGGSVRQP